MNTTVHELKVWPAFYRPKIDGVALFDVRLNDRGFQKGDHIRYQEFDPDTKEFTGRSSYWLITYVHSWAMQPGHVALGIRLIEGV